MSVLIQSHVSHNLTKEKQEIQPNNFSDNCSHLLDWVYTILAVEKYSIRIPQICCLTSETNCGIKTERSRQTRKRKWWADEFDSNLCEDVIAKKSHFHAGMICYRNSPDFDFQRIFGIRMFAYYIDYYYSFIITIIVDGWTRRHTKMFPRKPINGDIVVR